MRTNDKIEKYNSFIHSNLKEFVDVFLNKDIKNKLNNNNRCRCPFHLSHDNDFAYNKRFGYWKCFGKCNEVVGESAYYSGYPCYRQGEGAVQRDLRFR